MPETDPPPESASPLAESKEPRLSPVLTAALFGGTMAAAASAYFGTRALARKNREKNGKPLNSVMAAAITACDVAHSKDDPPPSRGPPSPRED